jgi:phage terminase Nu1 subunit (DNA packaging protein)
VKRALIREDGALPATTVIGMAGTYLTTKGLALALGVSARTIQGWRQRGLITPALVTAGGQARWVEADVREQLRILAEQRQRDQDD